MNEQLDGTMWKHNKTGNKYQVLYAQVIECTNGREDIDYVVYTMVIKYSVVKLQSFTKSLPGYKCTKNIIS